MDETTTTTNADRAALMRKLAAVALACRHIDRDGNNSEHRYRYISADAVAKAVGDAALTGGLMLVPNFEPITPPGETYAVKSGALWRFCRVRCTLTAIDTDTGASQSIVGYGDGTDPADKAVLKAQTAAHRDLVKKLFLITSKEDIDGDPESAAETDREHPQRTAPQRAAPPRPAPPAPPPPVREAVAASDVLALVKRFESCAARGTLDTLNAERATAWTTFSRDQQVMLKAAAAEANEQVMAAESRAKETTT